MSSNILRKSGLWRQWTFLSSFVGTFRNSRPNKIWIFTTLLHNMSVKTALQSWYLWDKQACMPITGGAGKSGITLIWKVQNKKKKKNSLRRTVFVWHPPMPCETQTWHGLKMTKKCLFGKEGRKEWQTTSLIQLMQRRFVQTRFATLSFCILSLISKKYSHVFVTGCVGILFLGLLRQWSKNGVAVGVYLNFEKENIWNLKASSVSAPV